ncbi:hypothetical protein [Vibrio vulnificus]|uniref:hypothetical protein n=1 Tax=Vibrio vulnificus TaxID=672 RepID=UPI001302C015|nr:hypothetical protein [Vibrio vulnificus]
MTRINHVGYHTCKKNGGYEKVRNEIPFLSKSGTNQWLAQGYYFWTDSPYWAKKWGKEGDRAIGKFTINLCRETELLDLVGNVAHSQHFEDLIKMIVDAIDSRHRENMTVNRAINFLRLLEKKPEKKGIFPYLAVKAQDSRYDGSLCFIDVGNGNPPILRLKQRQQMCVYEEARDKISLNCFIEPEEFVQQHSLAQISSESNEEIRSQKHAKF